MGVHYFSFSSYGRVFFFPIRVDLRIDKKPDVILILQISFSPRSLSPAAISTIGQLTKKFNEIMYNIARMHLYVIFENKQYQHERWKKTRAEQQSFSGGVFSVNFWISWTFCVSGRWDCTYPSLVQLKKFNEIKIVAINCNRTVIGAECRLIAITWSPPDFTARQKNCSIFFFHSPLKSVECYFHAIYLLHLFVSNPIIHTRLF